MSKEKLRSVLTRRLKLTQPRFAIRKAGRWLNGSVVSDTFKGKTDLERQRMIWDALDAELGTEAARASVGMLLAYTGDEWDVPLEVTAPSNGERPRARKKAG